MAGKTLLERIFLAPYSRLPDSYYRFLELTLPSIHVLGFIHPPYCPPWDRGAIAACYLSPDQEKTKLLKDIYRGYQEFARTHGEKYLLETISLPKSEDEWAESRPYLRSLLKTPELASFDVPWATVTESIIFLELARELDERDIEVDNSLFKVKELEDLFKSSLGIEEEDLSEVDEPVKITVEELPRRSYFGYLIKRRMIHWLRVYFSRLPFRIKRCSLSEEEPVILGKDLPILLCISRDSMEELLDPIRTREERSSFNWSPEIINLVEVPNVFETMDDNSLYELNTSLAHDSINLWKALQDYIDRPENKLPLIEASSSFTENLNGLIIKEKTRTPSRFRLSIVYHPSVNTIKAWQLMDGYGYRLLENAGLPEPEPLPFMVFEEVGE